MSPRLTATSCRTSAPLCSTAPAIAGLWDALALQVKAAGYTLERGDCHGANGCTDHIVRTVRVRDDVSDAQATKTLCHELAHVLLHPDTAEYFQCRGRCEVEAESVAYLVCQAAGLVTDGYSWPYIAHWSDGKSQGGPGHGRPGAGSRTDDPGWRRRRTSSSRRWRRWRPARRRRMAGGPLRVLGYVRVTTEEQGRSGAGLAAQRSAIRRACEERGYELVEVVEDAGFSAKSLERPGITRVLERLDAGRRRCARGGQAGSALSFAARLRRTHGTGQAPGVGTGGSGSWGGHIHAGRRDDGQRPGHLRPVRATHDRTADQGCARPEEGGRGTARPASTTFRRSRAGGSWISEPTGLTLQAIADELNAEGVATAQGGALWRPEQRSLRSNEHQWVTPPHTEAGNHTALVSKRSLLPAEIAYRSNRRRRRKS